uniref:RING-type domain-containing protein n=1 Tax=Chenopodium quinoa TaxID=63459 RepID=A0A803M0C4_CHEQI
MKRALADGILDMGYSISNLTFVNFFLSMYKENEAHKSIEARGFIFGPPIALAIGAKFVPLRKPRKLPGTYSQNLRHWRLECCRLPCCGAGRLPVALLQCCSACSAARLRLASYYLCETTLIVLSMGRLRETPVLIDCEHRRRKRKPKKHKDMKILVQYEEWERRINCDEQEQDETTSPYVRNKDCLVCNPDDVLQDMYEKVSSLRRRVANTEDVYNIFVKYAIVNNYEIHCTKSRNVEYEWTVTWVEHRQEDFSRAMEVVKEGELPTDEGFTCAICLEEVKEVARQEDELNQVARLVSCEHMFHNACIRRWVKDRGHGTCPLCRSKLPEPRCRCDCDLGKKMALDNSKAVQTEFDKFDKPLEAIRGNMERQKVNQSVEQREKNAQQSLAKLVCCHKVAPHSFCDGSLTQFVQSLNPLFEGFKFETLERNCLKLYEDDKLKVKDVFSKLGGQISLSVDVHVHEKRCDHYLCLSAHFIDDDWKLRNWVIRYCPVYDGTSMGCPSEVILKSLKEYDIESKILTVTDGGTYGSDMADIVKESCSCDVVSRMAQVGFEEIDTIIEKVQLLSWSKSEPVWYLTTSKLLDALELEAMGEFSSVEENGFYEVPSKEEWEKVRSVCNIAERIYGIVEGLFLEYKRPTPNLFLPHFQEIRAYLTNESESSDAFFIEFCPADSRTATYLENIRAVYDGYMVECGQKEYPLSDCSDSEDEEEEIEEGSETQAKKKRRDILENLSFAEGVLVLHWWKDNGCKYPQLSRMAHDFLAIPMSVATSYDAYYTEQRGVERTLLSLKPKLVNALKCTRSWKLDAKKEN